MAHRLSPYSHAYSCKRQLYFVADDRPVDSASPYYFVDGIIRTEDFNKNISLLQKIQKKVKLIRAN